MRQAENVARKWQIRTTFRTSVGQPERKKPVVRPRSRWIIILKQILDRKMGLYGPDSFDSGLGAIQGSYKHGDESSFPSTVVSPKECSRFCSFANASVTYQLIHADVSLRVLFP